MKPRAKNFLFLFLVGCGIAFLFWKRNLLVHLKFVSLGELFVFIGITVFHFIIYGYGYKHLVKSFQIDLIPSE